MDKLKLINFDKYRITKDGKIFSLYKNDYLTPFTNKYGYAIVSLSCTDNKFRPFFLHRVIWFYFNGEIPDGYEINHKDENQLNSSLENLELMTHVDNINYGTRNTRTSQKLLGKPKSEEAREKMRNASDLKPIIQCDYNTGKPIKEWKSVMQAARELGFKTVSGIYRVCKGERKAAYGFKWKFT